MEYKNIIVETSNLITKITINRPNQLNALNKETIKELHYAFLDADNSSKTGVIIITGSGEKAFVAGADIKEFSDFSVSQGKDLAASGQKLLFDFVENLSTPVIAAINGFALGGGLELAMSAHIRICSENAKMGLPEVSLGLIPGYGGTQRLAQLVGKGKANEMVFTAQMITSDDALSWGLVNAVYPIEFLINEAENLAIKILKNSPLAISSAIRSINSGYKNNINGYEVEIDEFASCFGTKDFKEGTSAFIEKRKASFR